MLLPEGPTKTARRKSQPHSVEGWERGQDGIGYCNSRENIRHHSILFQQLMEMASE